MAGEPRDFGPYQLIRRLGVGGMAETFEAARAGAGGFEQRICLKRVLPAFSDDDEFVARFRREAKLAAQLRHSNIVGVIDFGEVDGVHYMSLELVDGVDLRSLLKSSPSEKLSPETVALIGMDLGYALEHAHGTLVHRDISPSNILLSRSGEAKLADFGIAKAIEDAAATASRSAKGKVPYMSPEHMRGEAVDARADLFSLGVVLFEAVAGCRPFDGAHDVETMQRILEGKRLRLEQVAPEVPAELRDVIERLIEVDRRARTPSASRLIEELAAVASPPAVRWELAKTVEDLRGGPKARMHVRAREEERDTELSRPPMLGQTEGGKPGTPTPERSRRGKRRTVLLAAALMALLISIVAGSQWLGESSQSRKAESGSGPVAAAGPASGPASAAGPVAAAGPAAVPVAAAGPASVPASGVASGVAGESEPQRAPRPAKGWLHIVVQPWGNVWIDGSSKGRAPIRARLSKGRHVIEAGRDSPARKRIVRVEAGTRKEVEFNLPD